MHAHLCDHLPLHTCTYTHAHKHTHTCTYSHAHTLTCSQAHIHTPYACTVQVSGALATRYRANSDTGKAHDMKGSGCMHPLSSEVVKVCLPGGQIKVRARGWVAKKKEGCGTPWTEAAAPSPC